MSENSLGKIPYWDEKADSFGVYVNMIEAYTVMNPGNQNLINL